jgi:transcriptional regulator with XRE-family HTH domain
MAKRKSMAAKLPGPERRDAAAARVRSIPERAPRTARSDDLDQRVGRALLRFRTDAGLTLQKLADEAGVSPGTIHKIEKGAMVPSLSVLVKVARALHTPVGDFVSEGMPEREQRYGLFRSGKRPALAFADLPVALFPIVAKLPDRKLDAGIFVVEPGAQTAKEPLSHPGEKLYFVLKGRVRFEVDGHAHVLEKGDAMHLKATLAHRWESAAEEVSELIFVMTPPLGGPTEA